MKKQLQLKDNALVLVQKIKYVTTIEKEIYLAYINDKCIKEFVSEEDYEPLYAILWKWENYAGFSSMCSPEEIDMNLNFIQKNFGFLNIKDLDTAIDLATSGNLEIIKSKADESFARFSPTYIGRILQSYIVKRKDFIHRVKSEISKEELKPIPLTNDELLNTFKSYLVFAFTEKIKENDVSDEGNSIYNFIHYNKLIEINENLIEEARKYAIRMIDIDSKNTQQSYLNNPSTFSKTIIGLKLIDDKEKTIDKSIRNNNKDQQERIRIKYCKKYIVNVWLENMVFIEKPIKSIEKQQELYDNLNVFLDTIFIDTNKKFIIKK